MVERRCLAHAVVDVAQLFGVAQIAVVGLSAHNPVVGVVREVYRPHGNSTLVLAFHTGSFVGIAVADGVPVISADADTQPLYRVVVEPYGSAVFVGIVIFHR